MKEDILDSAVYYASEYDWPIFFLPSRHQRSRIRNTRLQRRNY